jgi:hypothetical protein
VRSRRPVHLPASKPTGREWFLGRLLTGWSLVRIPARSQHYARLAASESQRVPGPGRRNRLAPETPSTQYLVLKFGSDAPHVDAPPGEVCDMRGMIACTSRFST